MSLSSIPFLFGALPPFLLLYYLSKPKYRIYELLVFSGWFYYVNDPARLKFLAALIAVNYICSKIMERAHSDPEKKLWSKLSLTAGILINIGVLFLYKYLAFSVHVWNQVTGMELQTKERTMMAGLSFFVFGLISYLVDVYRGDVYRDDRKKHGNILHFFSYVLMFPKILMGPIIRYREVETSLAHMELKQDDIGDGAKRFMCGFFKKVIIADNLAMLVQEVNAAGNFSEETVAALWIGSIAYSLQLFFDFSGYSDMAIGLARMLGFRFSENFNYPYCCKSFTDFWRRWHISLSSWFRDYVYIPLGGSRSSFARNLLNLLVVWLLTGIWHGAGYAFIAWGLVYFVMLVLERYVIKPQRFGKAAAIGWRIVTLLVVNFNWVLFSHNGLRSGLQYCLGMLGFYYGNPLAGATDVRLLREYGLYLILGILFSMPVIRSLEAGLERKEQTRKIMTVAIPLCYVVIFIWALSFSMLGFHNPFMYQQF